MSIIERSTVDRARRRLIFFAVSFVVILIGGGIWFFIVRPHRVKKTIQATSATSQYSQVLRFKIDDFKGYFGVRCPEMKSYVAADSTDLVLDDDKANYVARITALRDGTADMAVFTVDSLIKASAVIGEFPATIVAIIDKSDGADAVVAWKDTVRSIDDLNRRDARFVLTPDSPSEFLGRVVVFGFDLGNLPKNWIEEADGAADVYKRLMKASGAEKKKAYVLWEPYLSMALKNPGIHVLFSSDKLKDCGIYDVIVARRDFLKEKPEVVKSFVKSYLQAMYSHKEDMVESILNDSKIAGEKLSREDANNITQRIQFKNTLENYAHFGLLSKQEMQGLAPLEDIIAQIKKILIQTGAIKSSVDIKPTDLFYRGILAEFQKDNFHPGKKLDFIETSANAKLDAVRGEAELPELPDEQWKLLVPVGKMKVEPLEFISGGAELTTMSKSILEELASTLNSMPLYYVLVTGHARAIGDMDENRKLAEDRANVTSQYLVSRLGVNKNRVKPTFVEPSSTGGEAQSVTFKLGQKPY